ncbi:SDR family NAD(P)-dependent oxidoreductase [Anaerocolumna xylanovorans]|uniref:Short chain dehydrogenase n=1 Tax=Anaerocolumna xylanovorans DSM 12503 TaxID=1121345 RepID=A0A1M7YIR9_9FIRM|nr:SDR family NAD(P)-dependent oxidoreductase [Anaerocolumna xylanovorans]SHO52513.1 short chain dehydrogenase [Anaerocolumna xylanovorans DSM 12503]
MKLSGKTCLITGANSGLGFATAKQFAELGANVVLVCRDFQKGKNAMKEIKKEVPGANLELMICDLASIKSILDFTKKFKETHSELNVLFNNAAVLTQNRTVTEDGYEMMFQINYLAPVLLTTSLLDMLKGSTEARIINIAVPPEKLWVNFDDLQFLTHYKPFDEFMRTKLYLLLYSIELSKRLAGTGGIIVNSIDPGLFKSGLRRESPWLLGKITDLFAVTADKAAESIVFHTLSNEAAENSGKVFVRRQEKMLIPYWNDSQVRKRLWSVTESLIDKHSTV